VKRLFWLKKLSKYFWANSEKYWTVPLAFNATMLPPTSDASALTTWRKGVAGLAIGFAVPALAQQKDTADAQIAQQVEAIATKNDEAINKNDAAAVAARLGTLARPGFHWRLDRTKSSRAGTRQEESVSWLTNTSRTLRPATVSLY
jgi:hypothetical protein